MVLSVPVRRIPPLLGLEPELPEEQPAASSKSGTAIGSARSRSFRVILNPPSGRFDLVILMSDKNAGGQVAGCTALLEWLQLGIDGLAALLRNRAPRRKAASGGYRRGIGRFSGQRPSSAAF